MAEEQESATIQNTVTVEDAGPSRKKVIVEIPAEAVKTAIDQEYENLRKEAIVPGFRKGRAPRRLLEKRFGKETREQVKLKLIADASDAAIKDNELNVLRDPEIDFEHIELPDSGPLKFEFEVEVRPEFELPPLEGIPIKKTKLETTDSEIDAEIEKLRKWLGVWAPCEEGTVEVEDKIIADVTLKAEDDDEGKILNDVEIYVRPSGFVGPVPVENLDEFLVGAGLGQTRETTVDVPKTFFREEYRGKKINVKVKIKEIKRLKPAELDEHFLRRYGVESEEELRDRIRDMLQERVERMIRTDMEDQVYKYLLDNTDFDLPSEVVADFSSELLKRKYTDLMMQGLPKEEIERNMEQLQAGSERQAKEQLKVFFIMDKVAEKLGIEVSEEEVNGYIAQLALRRGQRPERMKEQMMRDGSLNEFKMQIRQNKCVAKLLESAEITEVEPPKKEEKKKKKMSRRSAASAKRKAPRKKNEKEQGAE